jgi:hypothetical protein
MRSLGFAALALASALTGLATPALAEEATLPNVKIVVVDPRQGAAFGGPAVAKALRKKLDVATGKTVPAAAYTKAVKALKLKGSALDDPANIARAGKQAGADYVLTLSVTKKGWLYTANALLINTATGEQQMDFKSGYYKPKQEAADRGERIARVTVEKLTAILAGGGGAIAVVTPPAAPAPDDIPDPTSDRVDPPRGRDRDRVDPPPPPTRDRVDTPPARVVDPPPARGGASDRLDEPPPAPRGGASDDRLDGPPPAPAPAIARNDPPPTRSSEPEARPLSRPDRISEPRDDRAPTDLVRATVQGGAGVLHTFDLDSADGRRSRLSYQLDPLALISGEVEVLIPVVNTGVFARAAFSPVRYQVNIGRSSDEPTGSILDLVFGLKLHLTLTGEGREAVQLSPMAGLRLGILGVSDHPSNLILGSTSVAPFLGGELSLPLTEAFEALVALEVGLVVGYSETPSQSKNGEFGSGLSFGTGLGLRYWLTDALGIAFDGRFDLRSISLSGRSQRQAPSGEDLSNASIGNRDLRFSVGVALRL